MTVQIPHTFTRKMILQRVEITKKGNQLLNEILHTYTNTSVEVSQSHPHWHIDQRLKVTTIKNKNQCSFSHKHTLSQVCTT